MDHMKRIEVRRHVAVLVLAVLVLSKFYRNLSFDHARLRYTASLNPLRWSQ